MHSAAQLKMIDLEDVAFPITWRFNLSTSWGASSQEITMNVPGFTHDLPPAIALGVFMWRDIISTILTTRVVLDFVEVVRWKISPLPLLGAAGAPAGQIHAQRTSRENSGVLVLHTGHYDAAARRRFYVPNMPVSWVADRLMTDAGTKALYDFAAIMLGGSSFELPGAPLEWMIPYPDVIAPTLANLRGVAFRRVQYVRVCSFPDKAPDTVPIDWP